MRIFAAGLAAAIAFAGAAQAAPPANLAPRSVSGFGWNVIDLEGMRTWYETRLGMKVVNTYSRDGRPFEYILTFDGAPAGGAILALLATPQRKPGANSTSRLILRVPDSKALAEHLAREGVQSRLVAPGAYFFNDPEGNPIELYTPPAPK